MIFFQSKSQPPLHKMAASEPSATTSTSASGRAKSSSVDKKPSNNTSNSSGSSGNSGNKNLAKRSEVSCCIGQGMVYNSTSCWKCSLHAV